MTERHFERGTTIVETALVLGVLLFLLFGIMDFGRLLYTYHLVDNAARLGSRFAIVRGAQCQHYVSGPSDPWPCPTSKAAAQLQIANFVSQQSIILGLDQIPANKITTQWSYVSGCAPPSGSGAGAYNNEPGCQVSVTVKYTYQFLLPGMPGTSIPLSSTSTMLISQ